MTLIQRTIMRLLDTNDFVRVHGVYAGDVLSLQAQGLVTARMSEGQFEVRKVETKGRGEIRP